MALKDYKINRYSKPVSSMPDVPGSAGYTTQQIKEWFDSNANNEIKSAINTIVDFLSDFTDDEKIKGIRIGENGFPEITLDGTEWLKPFDLKVDKEEGKGLSANDYTNEEKAAVATIGNKVDKEAGKGLSANDYTDAEKAAVATIGNKVDKDGNKGLSTNDYTNEEKAAVATISNKVDKDGNKVLSTNDYTNEDKALITNIAYKADKANVIEKDSTAAYTPTADTHPVNKGYVDRAINEKVSELGAGDMSKAVYDPQNRNTDVFAEIDRKASKAAVLAAGNIAVLAGDGSYVDSGLSVNEVGDAERLEAIEAEVEQVKTDVEQVKADVAGVKADVADKAPMYSYGTEDMEAGVTPLETGKLYFQYE